MISLRSWYFVISFLLVRCRGSSVALESKDFVPRECEGDDCSTAGGRINEVTKLFRRVTEQDDGELTLITILVGGCVGFLFLILLMLFIFTRVRRQQIMDIEKRLIKIDGETHFPPASPPSRRSSWAEKLRGARQNLWVSSNEKPQVLFDDTASDRKSTLPFHDIPPLQKPAAVLDSPPRLDPSPKEKNLPYAVPLPVEAYPTPLHYDDVDSAGSRSNRPPPEYQMSAATGGGVVAQTIIASKQKSRHVHFASDPTSPELPRSRSRKGSLLSNPPLTVQNPRQLPSIPTAEDLAGGIASSHPKIER